MKTLIFSTLLCLALFQPAISASAQGLVPCGGAGQDQCQACHVIELGNDLIATVITLLIFFAGLLFVYAGYLMVTSGGNMDQVSRAKKVFTNVFIGFLIMLGGWLAVDTFMKSLLPDGETKLGPWNQIQCVSQNPAGVPLPSPGTGTVITSEGSLTHKQAVDALEAAGIEVTSTAGKNGVQAGCSGTGCTSLENMNDATVKQALLIKEGCPSCILVVTGGTEGGVHGSGGGCTHVSGCKIDIDDNRTLDRFLDSTLKRSGSRSGDPRYLDSCGNEYVRESTHWDIKVSAGACKI